MATARLRLHRLLSLGLGLFLMAAAVAKLIDLPELITYLNRMTKLPGIAAAFLVAVEFCVGTALALGWLRERMVLLVPSLILLLTIAHVTAYYRLGATSCPCGLLTASTLKGVLVKNVALLAASLALLNASCERAADHAHR